MQQWVQSAPAAPTLLQLIITDTLTQKTADTTEELQISLAHQLQVSYKAILDTRQRRSRPCKVASDEGDQK